MSKVCNKCCVERPIERYPKRDGYPLNKCQDCFNLERRERYRTDTQFRAKILGRKKQHNSHSRRKRGLKARYGLTYDEYEVLFQEQGGLCKICGNPESRYRNGTRLRLSVDHNHTSGVVRSLFCSGCNLVIGNAREDTAVLRNAIAYLEAYAE